MTPDHALGGMYDVAVLKEHQDEAVNRLHDARRMCDAVANMPYKIQEEATSGLLDAKAVCAEWCVPAARL